MKVTKSWRMELPERQQSEIEFAEFYATHLAHGTDGHARLILIRDLARLLDLATGTDNSIESTSDAEADPVAGHPRT